MLKSKKCIKLLVLAMIFMFLLAACGNGDDAAVEDEVEATMVETVEVEDTTAEEVIVDTAGVLPPEGPDTNNGRPFNAVPLAWDDRDTNRFLHGVNMTVLPLADEIVEVEFWRGFSSTIIQSLNESEVFEELTNRTNVHIVWSHPPEGQADDNFMLRVAADDLPHVFIHPPTFPGGNMAAIDEGIYLDLTPYYDVGWMPNLHWLRTGHPDAAEIRTGTTDDFGRILNFPMIDIVPAHPWMGLWIRQDYLDSFGFEAPTTIQEWDTILRTWREERGSWVLGQYWGGVNTDSAFVGSFDARRNWMNMDGVAAFGPLQPGFAEYLALMNSWFADGIIDPDFSTRTWQERYALVADGTSLAFNMAYGGIGQQLLTGRTHTPEMALTPLPNPARFAGAPVRISSQDNSIVRGDRSWVTDRVYDDGITEIVIRLMDYFYSQDGGDLLSYGIPGHASVWDDSGDLEWIHPLLQTPDADFWTVVYGFKMRPFPFLRDSTAYYFVPEVWECISVWGNADNSWILPTDLITFTPDEATENASIMVDVEAHAGEQALAFIVGARPLDEFDAFIAELESMNIHRAVEIHQAALDRLLAR